MSNANRELLERFYAAFARRDGAAMGACYHPHARFRDPVFTLEGPAIGTMWRMLCTRGADLRVEYSGIVADAGEGAAQWQAWYTFSSSGRKVHNRVRARFRFADGLIVEHVDDFDFWRWSRQALGGAGLLLGWTPQLRRKVCAEAQRALARFAAVPG
jgi:ketosteroid isomerase-like protein